MSMRILVSLLVPWSALAGDVLCADPGACHALATRLDTTVGVARDAEAVADAYGRACDGGVAPACVRLGELIAMGDGAPADPALAVATTARGCVGADRKRSCLHVVATYAITATSPLDDLDPMWSVVRACAAGDARLCAALAEPPVCSDAESCFAAGAMDPGPAGLRALKKACDAGVFAACGFAANRTDDPEWSVKGCPGDGPSCHHLGLATWAVGDREGALGFFEEGCRTDPSACVDLARANPDAPRATRLLSGACGAGDRAACVIRDLRPLGLDPVGLDVDCAAGDALACHDLAVRDLTTSVPPPTARGRALAERAAAMAIATACGLGEAVACANLGGLRGAGLGLPPDPADAADLLGRACAAGDDVACGGAARAGVSDPAALERACTSGDPAACFERASLLRARPGLDRDMPTALSMFEAACSGGDARGCTALGDVFLKGDGVRPDASAAYGWFVAACEAGASEPCASAARLASGHLVGAPDPERAAMLYGLACERGVCAP